MHFARCMLFYLCRTYSVDLRLYYYSLQNMFNTDLNVSKRTHFDGKSCMCMRREYSKIIIFLNEIIHFLLHHSVDTS